MKSTHKKTEAKTAEGQPGAVPEASFEEAFAVVESAVVELERGNLSLEASLKEYERGLSSLGRCFALLEEAQRRIEVLAAGRGEGDPPAWVPAESVPALREAIEHLERPADAPGGE